MTSISRCSIRKPRTTIWEVGAAQEYKKITALAADGTIQPPTHCVLPDASSASNATKLSAGRVTVMVWPDAAIPPGRGPM